MWKIMHLVYLSEGYIMQIHYIIQIFHSFRTFKMRSRLCSIVSDWRKDNWKTGRKKSHLTSEIWLIYSEALLAYSFPGQNTRIYLVYYPVFLTYCPVIVLYCSLRLNWNYKLPRFNPPGAFFLIFRLSFMSFILSVAWGNQISKTGLLWTINL